MRSRLVVVSGVLLLASSLAHGLLGWPAMHAALSRVGAPADLVGGLGAGWMFGTAAMITFGVIVLAAGLRMRSGDLSLVLAVRAVSVCYLVFGLAAFFLRHLNPHFLFFIAMGLVTGLPVLRGTRPRT